MLLALGVVLLALVAWLVVNLPQIVRRSNSRRP